MPTPSHNVVGWFEIPVLDMDRAVKFYETVLQLSLARHTLNELEMAWFPFVADGIGSGGSLVKHAGYIPSQKEGVLIYFTAPNGDLDGAIARVAGAGGSVILPRRKISDEYGFMGLIVDTEGNRIALHSRT
jgi:predicted enzyme related to lactoylglutathione lyase